MTAAAPTAGARYRDSVWLPRSDCGPRCLPPPGAVPAVGPLRLAGRLAGVLGVLVAALATLPVLLISPPAGRNRIVRLLARGLLRTLGVRHQLRGRLPRCGALVVANHVSWLDTAALLAHLPVRLVAKREVRSWPVVGLLATAAGTLFIDRSRPRTLPATITGLAAALRAGQAVAVFPEATTWCGEAGGPFRPATFQAAIDAGAAVVPVTLRYQLADGTGTTVAAFLGDDALLPSLRRVIAAGDLRIAVHLHPALHPGPGGSRRTLARAAHASINRRAGHLRVTR